MRWVPDEKRTEERRPDEFSATLEAFGRSMTQAAEAVTRMFEQVRPVVEAQAKVMGRMMHSVHRSLYPKQHQRCVTCHPWRKPKPLCVDGHEYQRRLRARRRRR